MDSDRLALNDLARIRIAFANPLPIDAYNEYRGTGAFILVDAADGWTLGAGMAGPRPSPSSTAGPPTTPTSTTSTPPNRRTDIMTAPSLILVGYGSRDPRVAQVSHDIRAGVLAIRPELDVHIAFVGDGQPNGLQVAAKLAKRGVEEAVVVPLLLPTRSTPTRSSRRWSHRSRRPPRV